jgi:uncharacterized protein
MDTTQLHRLTKGSYVLLTTFRRDGTPVPTPVWGGRDGDELIVWTRTDTGKVKRIRNSGGVELSECDIRGRPRGPVVKGTARILDAEGSDRGRKLLRRKYGLTGWLVIGSSVLFRGRDKSLCVAISLDG